MKRLQVRIRRLDYEHAFEIGCNHPDEIRSEKTECAKYGPSLRHIADFTPYGSDVLIAENLPCNVAVPFDKERIPCSGHSILVHGETSDQDVLIEFILSGFGPHDLRIGEHKHMPVRQKIAIQKSKAGKTGKATHKTEYEPGQVIPIANGEAEDYYG